MAYIPPLNGGRINASIGGNSTSAGAGYALVSTGTMVLAGGNNITLSQNGQNITISGPNAGGGSINFSASNTSANLASVTFSNANGVSFGLNAGVITASHNALTSQSNQALSGSNGSFAFQTATFGNLNGLSFYSSNGSLVGSYTVPTQSNQTLSQAVTGNTVGNTSGVSVDARSLTLQGLGAASVGLSTSAGGSSVIVSTPTQTVQTQNLHNLTLAGNSTSAGVGYAQVSSGTLTLAGGNNITLSQNGNAITISGGAGGGGGIALANSQTTYTSGTANLIEAGGAITIASTTGQSFWLSVPATSSLSATGALSISSNGSTISMGVPAFSAGMSNIGNTSGTTGTVSNQLVLAGGNNVTLSQATGAGGNTITIAAGGGGGGATLSRWEYPDDVFASLSTIPNASLSIQHMYIPFNVTGSAGKIAVSFSAATNALSSTATANISLWMGMYTLSGSTLSLASSGSINNSFTWNGSAAGGVTGVTGMRQLTVPFASMNITPGEYWVAAAVSSAVNGGAATMTLYGNNLIASAASNAVLSPFGASATSAARDVVFFEGIYTAATAAGPSTIAGSAINNYSAGYVQRANFYNVIFNATY